jgi:membrane dipeptidase
MVFSIATWPFRRRRNRTRALLGNLARLRAQLERGSGRVRVIKDHAGYVKARADGRVGLWIGIQGGNALDSGSGGLGSIPDDIVSRITLVHLTRSTLGGSSSPGGRNLGLTAFGREFVAEMNRRRIVVDLAHISKQGFWDALEVHDRSQPAIVSHTGVCGVTPHWRNLDDAQVRAIADSGGVVGILFHSTFLGAPFWGGRASSIVDHMQHVMDIAGEDAVAIGSDWDGLICTPRDMPTVLELPVLVERMLARGWSADRIRKVLGGNYLRVLKTVRPGA